ncbi:MAG: polysaccharide deacetylase family protein [Chloroflexi bacterium]|nr:polysaccharide deacetylase family protein [Chloroflexota bacterium]
MSERIQVVLGIDMETDIGSWTPYYEGVRNGTPRLLDLMDRLGITGTFFFTGEAARENPVQVRDVIAAGHEVGCHSLYHETVGDELFPIPGVKPLLPEEVSGRLALATEWVGNVAGFQPVSFRCPRLWGSTAVVNALEGLGYVADASYPMFYYAERLGPYHPSQEDWTQEGDMRLLEIPVFADLSVDSKDQYGRDRDQWPLFRTHGADAVVQHIESFLSYLDEHNVAAVLCFYFHPWEFVEMPSGLIHYGEGSVLPDSFLVSNCGDVALRELESLTVALQGMRAEFRTAGGLARAW